MHYNQNKQKSVNYNIPLYKFFEVYEKIEKALEAKPVVIGGRAINFLCSRDTRYTHDIDMVVPNNPAESQGKLIDAGFMLKWNGPRLVGATYLDKEGTEPGRDMLTIDFYSSRPVNGLSINEILQNSVEIKLPIGTVLVPRPSILMLMKYDAGRRKDMDDFKLLLQNFYAGNINTFFEKEGGLMDSLLEAHINDGKKLNKLLLLYHQRKEDLKSLSRC
ncbi:MAG: hypothetical protein M1544_03745 [Candidatus Marsarchaeota archaeon]|nr:hypothetical protein [Candidatus Marsarchaeota archaeon]